MQMGASPPGQVMYGTIDYGAFSEPPNVLTSAPPQDMNSDHFNYNYEYIPSKPVSNGYGKSSNCWRNSIENYLGTGFYQSIPEQSNTYKSAMTPSPNSIPSGPMSGSGMGMNKSEVSRFGFGYESLSQNIDELELATDDPQAEAMFQKAKDLITWENATEAENILKQMLDSGEIRYKQISGFENDLFMNTFNPLQDYS